MKLIRVHGDDLTGAFRLFFALYKNVERNVCSGQVDPEDLAFIRSLPTISVWFGLSEAAGKKIQTRLVSFETLYRRKPKPRTRRPYQLDTRALDLHDKGHSIREIQEIIDDTRSNVHRMIQENPGLFEI